MSMRRALCAAFAWVSAIVLPAQSDSASFRPAHRMEPHSPGRAALYSALLPGAGQAYNRAYWKIPIAWAGLGLSYYFIQRNGTEYDRYKDAYLAVVDNDPGTVDEFNGAYSAASLLNVADTYRRWRDLSYISLGLVYILNIMDATVDAYFVRFDVSPDLGMALEPGLPLAAMGAAGISLTFTW